MMNRIYLNMIQLLRRYATVSINKRINQNILYLNAPMTICSLFNRVTKEKQIKKMRKKKDK